MNNFPISNKNFKGLSVLEGRDMLTHVKEKSLHTGSNNENKSSRLGLFPERGKLNLQWQDKVVGNNFELS